MTLKKDLARVFIEEKNPELSNGTPEAGWADSSGLSPQETEAVRRDLVTEGYKLIKAAQTLSPQALQEAIVSNEARNDEIMEMQRRRQEAEAYNPTYPYQPQPQAQRTRTVTETRKIEEYGPASGNPMASQSYGEEGIGGPTSTLVNPSYQEMTNPQPPWQTSQSPASSPRSFSEQPQPGGASGEGAAIGASPNQLSGRPPVTGLVSKEEDERLRNLVKLEDERNEAKRRFHEARDSLREAEEEDRRLTEASRLRARAAKLEQRIAPATPLPAPPEGTPTDPQLMGANPQGKIPASPGFSGSSGVYNTGSVGYRNRVVNVQPGSVSNQGGMPNSPPSRLSLENLDLEKGYRDQITKSWESTCTVCGLMVDLEEDVLTHIKKSGHNSFRPGHTLVK